MGHVRYFVHADFFCFVIKGKKPNYILSGNSSPNFNPNQPRTQIYNCKNQNKNFQKLGTSETLFIYHLLRPFIYVPSSILWYKSPNANFLKFKESLQFFSSIQWYLVYRLRDFGWKMPNKWFIGVKKEYSLLGSLFQVK